MIVACGSFASTHVFTFPSLSTRIRILVDYRSVSTTNDYVICSRTVRVLASNSSIGAPLVLLADVVVFGHVQEVHDGLRGQQQMLVQKIHLRAEWYTWSTHAQYCTVQLSFRHTEVKQITKTRLSFVPVRQANRLLLLLEHMQHTLKHLLRLDELKHRIESTKEYTHRIIFTRAQN